VLLTNMPYTALLTVSNLEWFRYDLIWEKSKAAGFLNARRRPMRAHEQILVFSRGEPPYNPQMRPGKPYDKGLVKKQSQNDVYGQYRQVVVKSKDGQ
jgi:site-specific DNA-methyltransferase (adenine-specific)